MNKKSYDLRTRQVVSNGKRTEPAGRTRVQGKRPRRGSTTYPEVEKGVRRPLVRRTIAAPRVVIAVIAAAQPKEEQETAQRRHGRKKIVRVDDGGRSGTGDERAADNRGVPWDAWRRKSDAAEDRRARGRGLGASDGGRHAGAYGCDAESLPTGGRRAGGAHGRGGAAHGQGKPGGHQAAAAATGHDSDQQGEGRGRVEDKVQDTFSTRSAGDVTRTRGTTSAASMTPAVQ